MDRWIDVDDVLVDCRSIWKVFGSRAPEAMRAIAERALGKTEVLKEFGCVVGVSDATIEVRRGEIFCIMGLSGSGKSTLIRMLNRLIDRTSGEIFVKGRSLSKMNAAELRAMLAKHIATVFQSVALLPNRTVVENAAFGLEVQGVAKGRTQARRRGVAQEGSATGFSATRASSQAACSSASALPAP
jgi:glycine betaine/proline transport system ATP-binding protein